MTPPEAVACAVGIPVSVRVLMVLAMVGHPVDWPAFYGQRPEQSQTILHRTRTLEGPMGQQAVIAYGDSQDTADSVQKEADCHRCPGRMPRGRHRSQVNTQQEDDLYRSKLVSNWYCSRGIQECCPIAMEHS